MTKEFKTYRVFAKHTTHYENTYEAESKEEATALAEKYLEKDFPYYNKFGSSDVEIYDTTEVT